MSDGPEPDAWSHNKPSALVRNKENSKYRNELNWQPLFSAETIQEEIDKIMQVYYDEDNHAVNPQVLNELRNLKEKFSGDFTGKTDE